MRAAAKLAAISGGSPALNVFQVRQILLDHDELEVAGIMTYAISGLLPPR